MINRLKNSKAGFTLIELMICVSIIGILSAIAIPSFLSYRTKAFSAAAKSEASMYYTAALAHFADVAGDAIVEPANCPGFGRNVDIEVTEAVLSVEGATGVVSISTPNTFSHSKGGDIYVLGADGTITLFVAL